MGLRGKAWDAVGIGKVPGILGELDPNFDAQIADVSHDRRFDGTDIRRADTGSLGVRCRGGAQFRCRGILRMSGKRQ